MAIRLSDSARARLDQLVEKLRKEPPIPELGKATIGSVVSAAVMAGLDVLEEKYQLVPARNPIEQILEPLEEEEPEE